MKVVAFNGSPRKDGNTTILINKVFQELEKERIETELIQLSEKQIMGVSPATNASRRRISGARSRTMLQMSISKRFLAHRGLS